MIENPIGYVGIKSERVKWQAQKERGVGSRSKEGTSQKRREINEIKGIRQQRDSAEARSVPQQGLNYIKRKRETQRRPRERKIGEREERKGSTRQTQDKHSSSLLFLLFTLPCPTTALYHTHTHHHITTQIYIRIPLNGKFVRRENAPLSPRGRKASATNKKLMFVA